MPSGQLSFLDRDIVWKESLLAKIKGWVPADKWQRLASCGEQPVYRECKECHATTTLYTRCSLKYCPLCNFWIARKRSILLRHWVRRVTQPKHLVLTQRNQSSVLTRLMFRRTLKCFARLRRSKLFRSVKGGCVSMEVTNEGRGWHIHLHCLLDAVWLPIREVSIKWGKLVGQSFAIVCIKDCRGQSYLGEVTKYVCKPDQLVRWPVNQIIEFINAVSGVRFFATFGSLFKCRALVAAEIEAEKPPPKVCECGCSKFIIATDEYYVSRECRRK